MFISDTVFTDCWLLSAASICNNNAYVEKEKMHLTSDKAEHSQQDSQSRKLEEYMN